MDKTVITLLPEDKNPPILVIMDYIENNQELDTEALIQCGSTFGKVGHLRDLYVRFMDAGKRIENFAMWGIKKDDGVIGNDKIIVVGSSKSSPCVIDLDRDLSTLIEDMTKCEIKNTFERDPIVITRHPNPSYISGKEARRERRKKIEKKIIMQ